MSFLPPPCANGVLLLVWRSPKKQQIASFTPAAGPLTQKPSPPSSELKSPAMSPVKTLRPHNQNLATTGLRTTPVKKGLLESTATTATESPVTELKQLALGACSLRLRFSAFDGSAHASRLRLQLPRWRRRIWLRDFGRSRQHNLCVQRDRSVVSMPSIMHAETEMTCVFGITRRPPSHRKRLSTPASPERKG